MRLILEVDLNDIFNNIKVLFHICIHCMTYFPQSYFLPEGKKHFDYKTVSQAIFGFQSTQKHFLQLN